MLKEALPVLNWIVAKHRYMVNGGEVVYSDTLFWTSGGYWTPNRENAMPMTWQASTTWAQQCNQDDTVNMYVVQRVEEPGL